MTQLQRDKTTLYSSPSCLTRGSIPRCMMDTRLKAEYDEINMMER